MLKSTFSPMFSSLPAKIKRSITSPSSKPMKIAPSHTHPPSVRRNASTNSEVYHLNLPPPTSAYVHLPFCRKRCHYCDFPIVALGSSSSSASSNQTNREDFEDPRMVNYIDLLCREIAATAKTRSSGADTVPLETVFFGGGTPSLVPPRLVESVMEALNSNFGLSSFREAEVSMEMDPGTFDAERVKRFMGLGVNRVSLGIQAFQDELLKSCGRSHGIEEVREAVEIVRSCGVRNWGVDLISSLPRQTPEMWEQSLTLALDAGPTHVSVYDLQIEQGTKFGSLYTPGEFPLPSDSQSAEYYKTASRMLGEAGFEHYEISSYCKTGFECKHNQVYWKNVPFYAFGLGSASFIGGLRFSRPKSMRGYVDFVENLENGTVNWDKNDHIDLKDIASDVIMLSLRTSRGIDLRDFDKEFGSSLVRSLCDAFSDYVQSGHVVPLDEKRKVLSLDEFERVLGSEDESGIGNKIAYLRLSDPDGFLLSNEIISHAFRVISP